MIRAAVSQVDAHRREPLRLVRWELTWGCSRAYSPRRRDSRWDGGSSSQSEPLCSQQRQPLPRRLASFACLSASPSITATRSTPEAIGLAADGTLGIQGIQWHRWGRSKTSGQGTFVVYHQTSYKVIGRYETTITSSDPTRAHHRLLYGLINISVPAAVQRRRDLPHELHYWLLGGSYSSNW